ncbi:MAG: tripartite tricarboxylate transporter substrate binding protein, partial [Planctomycetes bacterium]|nr:tripartite tricarboxylate transporter substrate binding protein [Planctomycetota bacterium]
ESGKLKMIGVFGENRSDIFPDVPTVREQGVDVFFPVWRAVFTTAGTPPEVMATLSTAVAAAMEGDAFKRYAETSGLPVRFRGYEESGPFLVEEDRFYREMLDKLGMKISEPKR